MKKFEICDEVIYEKDGTKIEGKISGIVKKPDGKTIVGYTILVPGKMKAYIVNPNSIKRKEKGYKNMMLDVSDNITTVKVIDSYEKISEGTAICAPDDEFDIAFGIMLATARATKNKEVERVLIAQSYKK